MNLQQHNGEQFTYHQMTALIKEFDMFECETEEGLAVALTNQITGDPLPDCGEFFFDAETSLFTFKLYN